MLKACSACGHSRPINGACPGCGTVPRRSLSTSQRGYGWRDHQSRRQTLISLAWFTDCPLCTLEMFPDQALDLDHTIPLKLDAHSTGDRIVHAHCNRSAGARLAS